MKEIWKNVRDYPNYQISNLGRIKILNFKRTKKEKVFNGFLNNDGYFTIDLYNKGNSKTFGIHQLVAQEFLNHTVNGHKAIVDHIDGNKINNLLTNLQIISNRENTIKGKIGKKSLSGVGVYKNKQGKYRASIYVNNKKVYLGTFLSKEKANTYYQESKFKAENNLEVIPIENSNKTSKQRGVCFVKQRKEKQWKSYKRVNSKNTIIGFFDTEQEAINSQKD